MTLQEAKLPLRHPTLHFLLRERGPLAPRSILGALRAERSHSRRERCRAGARLQREALQQSSLVRNGYPVDMPARALPVGLSDGPSRLSCASLRHRWARSRKIALFLASMHCWAFSSHSTARYKQYSDVWGDDCVATFLTYSSGSSTSLSAAGALKSIPAMLTI
jgi:hypothetical protein